MASPFDKIDAAGQAAICDRLGEAVAFIGMADGEYTRGVDPLRPQIEAVAVTALRAQSDRVSASMQGRSSSGSSRVHGNSEIWVAKAIFDALAWQPRRDDLVLIEPGGADERRFKIAAVYPTGMGDVQIVMTEGGGADE